MTNRPMLTRVVLWIAAVAVVVAVSTAAIGKAAQAHNELGWGFCTGSGKVCAAIHVNGYGNYIIFTQAVGQCWGITGFMNNAISSVDSHHNGQANFYDNGNCTNLLATYAGWATVNSVGYNDRFSSICIGPRGGSTGCP